METYTELHVVCNTCRNSMHGNTKQSPTLFLFSVSQYTSLNTQSNQQLLMSLAVDKTFILLIENNYWNTIQLFLQWLRTTVLNVLQRYLCVFVYMHAKYVLSYPNHNAHTQLSINTFFLLVNNVEMHLI